MKGRGKEEERKRKGRGKEEERKRKVKGIEIGRGAVN